MIVIEITEMMVDDVSQGDIGEDPAAGEEGDPSGEREESRKERRG